MSVWFGDQPVSNMVDPHLRYSYTLGIYRGKKPKRALIPYKTQLATISHNLQKLTFPSFLLPTFFIIFSVLFLLDFLSLFHIFNLIFSLSFCPLFSACFLPVFSLSFPLFLSVFPPQVFAVFCRCHFVHLCLRSAFFCIVWTSSCGLFSTGTVLSKKKL